MMKLSYLLSESGFGEKLVGAIDPEITGITINSKETKPGWLFVAIKGFNVDGHLFIDDSIANGAAAIVGTEDLHSLSVPYIRVQDSRLALGRLSAAYYDFPAQKSGLEMIGITGTNGKSSTAIFTQYLLEKSNISTGLVGTIHYQIGTRKEKAVRTTPESHELQKMFRQMREKENKVAVMEVSSHALDLMRVECISFQTAAFTNLSAEHLDFHSNMENYFQAKAKLFSKYLNASGNAVFNMNDDYGRRLFDLTDSNYHRVTIGNDQNLDWNYKVISSDLGGMTFTLNTPWDSHEVTIPVVGEFNVSNAVMAAAIASGVPGTNYETIIRSLLNLPQIPGRLEKIADNIFVDYAHTPDALKKALTALKYPGNTLTVVFGAGGERDREKRPLMGQVAEKIADKILITNDNPRNESPESIAGEISYGISDKSKYQVILNRRDAIVSALSDKKNNEVVIIAGKGHEDYQEIQGKKNPFSDADVVREFIKI